AGFLIPALELAEADSILAYCHRHEDVWCALGVHPHSASTWQEGDGERLAALLADPKAVAVGECGLDFHYDFATPAQQFRCVRDQWMVARDRGLPVVVHNRDSNDAMLGLVALPEHDGLTGDFHSFAGGAAMAETLLDRGFYLGLSGMITFPKADNVREVIAGAPPERLLVETDTPYLAPVPYRGKPNRPAFVVEVCHRLAQERDEPPETTAARTTENFFQLFAKARGDAA
ncbi:MAG: TatD family hydrolase, partial [Acidobacteriota bacterium]